MDIYLAGSESPAAAAIQHHLRYPFRLASYFAFKNKTGKLRETLDMQHDEGSTWIMDSGLFSFMFGAEQGLLKTFEDYRAYALDYVTAMNAWGWKHTIVECDVQKVLGVEETFRLREDIFDHSGFEVMYVWHVPEGEEGLRKLARERKRIALSVPELRKIFGTGPTERIRLHAGLLQLIKIARAAGPAKIHLLGCTEERLMQLPADSCDSTSWQAGAWWGKGAIFNGGSLSTISVYSPRFVVWREWCINHYKAVEFSELLATLTDKNSAYYYGNAGVSLCAFWMFMEVLRGGERKSGQLSASHRTTADR